MVKSRTDYIRFVSSNWSNTWVPRWPLYSSVSKLVFACDGVVPPARWENTGYGCGSRWKDNLYCVVDEELGYFVCEWCEEGKAEILDCKYSKTWDHEFSGDQLRWVKISQDYDWVWLSVAWCTLLGYWSYCLRSSDQGVKDLLGDYKDVSPLERATDSCDWLCWCQFKNRRVYCLLDLLNICWRKWMGGWLCFATLICEVSGVWVWNWGTWAQIVQRKMIPPYFESHKMSLPSHS